MIDIFYIIINNLVIALLINIKGSFIFADAHQKLLHDSFHNHETLQLSL